MNNDEYTRHPHYCALCERIYQWSADDLVYLYEVTPNMPCGHPWRYCRDMEDDPRVFQVTTSRVDDPSYGETIRYVLSDLRVGYPLVYPIVKRPGFVHLKILDEPTRIEVSVYEPSQASTSPSHEEEEQ